MPCTQIKYIYPYMSCQLIKTITKPIKLFYRLTLSVGIGHTFHWFLALRVSGHIKAGYIKVFVPVIVH